EQRPHGVSIAEIVARATAAGSGRDAGEEDKPWRDAYYEVMNAWRQMDTLVEWMRELVGGGADAQLVVWDNTRFEVPWELFRHEDENAWLGELISVIRWTTVHDGARSWTYSAPEHASTGGVLMYEDKELAVPADRFHRYEVVPRKTTMGQLIRQLNDETVDFGLVVVRCHGKYSNDPRKMKLGGMPLIEFADVRMAALRRNRAPVLLNACVSARPVGVMPRSFAELFLRYGASAVIATVAEVGLNHSHEFAVRLLEKAEEGAVNIARALRDHRRAYAGPVRRDLGTDEDLRTEKDFELFFHGFMYVYFGHPGTTLRAIPQNGGACGGD
ncbi:MAG: hypothetical protein HOV68_11020, partial [Streptomycetaceae bacterium]|nr:hypothetical protein [Streptomycetaceae bacterium]